MPLEMCVIRAKDFIRATPTGAVDLVKSRAVLSKVAAECVGRGINCAVIDVRASPSPLSVAELYELAMSLREMGFRPEHRIAILHASDRAERAQFFALAAANRGWQTREFDSFERAFEWFAEVEPAEVQPR